MSQDDAVPVAKNACPCCKNLTLKRRSEYYICPVCFWEDDGQDDPHADEQWGGPNGCLSLMEARANFKEIGACQALFIHKVRRPTSQEKAHD